MLTFWYGYAAGLLSAILPSLVFYVVLVTRAPELN